MKNFKMCITTVDTREVIDVRCASNDSAKEHAKSLLGMYDVPVQIGIFEESANGEYDNDLREVDNGNWSFIGHIAK